jgi:ABC-2 type transport system permease protein
VSAGIVRQAGRQVRYQVRMLRRSPSGAFFTFAIPLMLLITLDLVYGNRLVPTRQGLRFPQFYTPAMMAFAVINACYTNLLTGTTIARENGMLKRVRGTPLPGWVYLFGRIGSAAVVAVLSLVAVLAAGVAFFDVDVVPALALALDVIVTVAAGIFCFCTLGLAVSIVVPGPDAALPVAYGTLLPVAFISDVFFPSDTSPAWLRTLADVLPLRPLARSLEAGFDLHHVGPGFRPTDIAVLVAWGVAAGFVVLRWFRWEPGEGRAHPTRRPRYNRRHSASPDPHDTTGLPPHRGDRASGPVSRCRGPGGRRRSRAARPTGRRRRARKRPAGGRPCCSSSPSSARTRR